MKSVYVMRWVEFERGWGSRPDGFSLHKSFKDAAAYYKKYAEDLPQSFVPDEYSQPDGEIGPYINVWRLRLADKHPLVNAAQKLDQSDGLRVWSKSDPYYHAIADLMSRNYRKANSINYLTYGLQRK